MWGKYVAGNPSADLDNVLLLVGGLLDYASGA